MTGHVLGLRCRECGAEYETSPTHVCPACFGPLDVAYDYAAIARTVSRERIESGPSSMWRYRDLLPVEDGAAVVSLGEGLTPLAKVVVAYVTGHGLKTADALNGTGGRRIEIDPSVRAFREKVAAVS